jgi:hypothetical protein
MAQRARAVVFLKRTLLLFDDSSESPFTVSRPLDLRRSPVAAIDRDSDSKTPMQIDNCDAEGRSMTREDKVQLLKKLFLQVSNHGVITWGDTAEGYRWTCEDQSVAQKLAQSLVEHIQVLGIDTTSFPYRFQLNGGATLIMEPVDD